VPHQRRAISCGSAQFIALLFAAGVCLTPIASGASRSQDPPGGTAPDAEATPANAGQIWTRDLSGAPTTDGAADADRLFLPLDTGELISLARETGDLVWSRKLTSRWPPVVIGDTLVAASETAVHELDNLTGVARRTLPLPSPPAGPLGRLGQGIVLSVTSGDLAAFDRSGRLIWTAKPGDVSRVPAAATPDGGFVYVALADGRLVGLRGADGEVMWSRLIGGTLAAPTVRDGRVYVGSSTRAVYAFDGRTGRLLWDFATGGDVVGTSADEESLYVVALDNVVRALHLSRGSLHWKRVPPTRPISAPVRSGARLLMGGVRPQLLAFDATTGEPITSFTMPKELELAMLASAPIVFPEMSDSRVSVALVTRDRRIIGLALEPPPVAAGSSDVEQETDDDEQKTVEPALTPN
jgi:outer membrane protein assembly factor BamB